MALIEETAPADVQQQRRAVRWLTLAVVGLVCLVAGFVGAAVWQATRPVPVGAPIFGSSDGLPSTLKAGTEYTAVLTIAVPSDWATAPGAPWIGDQTALGSGAALRWTGTDWSILCTDTLAPGSVQTLRCPFTVPDAPGPLEIVTGWPLGAGADPLWSTVDGPTSHTYQHTVVR